MAAFLTRYRRILLILCTFIMVLCLFVYITLAVCLAIAQNSIPQVEPGTSSLETFVVPKEYPKDGDLGAYPKLPYRIMQMNRGALWNSMQHVLDRQHNPILHRRTNELVTLSRSDNSKTNSTQDPLGCQPNYRMMWLVPDFFDLQANLQKFILSMHCRDYPLLINQPSVCGSQLLPESPMLLLAIKSQVKNVQNRQAIRRTWGRSGLVQGQVGTGGIVNRVFLLAMPDRFSDIKQMEMESKVYGDILMWDFMDTFFNLTLKDVLFWKWFSEHCQNARFVFKGDDDVFVRMPALLDYLQKMKEAHSEMPANRKKMEDFVVGDIISSAVPLRNKSNKYYIPESFYKGHYPPYAGGGGVIYSGALVLRLFQISKRVHLFPIDDVYMGMCLLRLGVTPITHPAFLTFDFTEDEAKEPCAHHTILLVHKRSPSQLLQLWSETLTPSANCSQTPLRIKVSKKKKNVKAKKKLRMRIILT